MAIYGKAAKAAGDVLGMALDRLGDAAPVARSMPDDAVASKALGKMTDEADDWGWKGGKEGELTAGEYMDTLVDTMRGFRDPNKMFDIERFEEIMDPFDEKMTKQLQNSSNPFVRQYINDYGIHDSEGLINAMSEFEKLDVPREWTGKLASAIFQNRSLITIPDTFEKAVAKAMKNLYVPGDPATTKARRDTFVALLPEWEDSVEKLADVARFV